MEPGPRWLALLCCGFLPWHQSAWSDASLACRLRDEKTGAAKAMAARATHCSCRRSEAGNKTLSLTLTAAKLDARPLQP
jgi:hypothetical protein